MPRNPAGRSGWVTSRYVRSPATGAPSPGTSPATIKPQRIEEGIVEPGADGDTVTVITAKPNSASGCWASTSQPPQWHQFSGAYVPLDISVDRLHVSITAIARLPFPPILGVVLGNELSQPRRIPVALCTTNDRHTLADCLRSAPPITLARAHELPYLVWRLAAAWISTSRPVKESGGSACR